MIFLHVVCRETLRLHPGIDTFMLRSIRDTSIREFFIPARTRLLISPALMHHSPILFTNPEEFDATRFQDGILPPALMPFSAGPKGCIANKFALAEMTMMVSMLVSNFTFRFMPRKKKDVMTDGLLMIPIKQARK